MLAGFHFLNFYLFYERKKDARWKTVTIKKIILVHLPSPKNIQKKYPQEPFCMVDEVPEIKSLLTITITSVVIASQ